MIHLRDYQHQMVAEARALLRAHRGIVMQAPTGAGKSATAAHMVGRAAEKGKRCYVVAHRHELIDQLSGAFWEQDITHGVIRSGRPMTRWPIQVCSIQTLARRLEHLAPPDMLLIDEAHRAASSSYVRCIEAWPAAYRVGLTATPQRTDRRGLDHLFSAMVQGPNVRELIEWGYLADYRLFGPAQAVDLSAVHTRAGDYVREEAEAAVDRPTITGDAVAHYQRLAPGKRAIVFCVSRKHAAHVAEQFRGAGIEAADVTGETPQDVRRRRLHEFRAGTLPVLVGVDLFIEGLDVPGAQVAIILRPTQSMIVHLQALGRVLRPAPGKSEAIILDHVGNTLRHGLPDDERQWSLEGRARRRRKADDDAPPIRQCTQCFAFFRPAPACPQCGAMVVGAGREPEERDGELAESDAARERRERRRQVAAAKSLEALQEIERERGYKPGWAYHVHKARQRRRA